MAADSFTVLGKVDVDTASVQRDLDEFFKTGSKTLADAINKQLGGKPVEQKLVVRIERDDKGAKKLAVTERESYDILDKIINLKKQADKIDQNSVTSLRQQVNNIKAARDGTAKYLELTNGLQDGVRKINPEWQEQNNKLKDASRLLAELDGTNYFKRLKSELNIQGLIDFSNGLSQIAQGLQTISIAVGQVRAAINTLVDALANLQTFSLAFKAIGAGAGGAEQALNESSRIALNLGVGIQTVRTGFQQLTPVVLNSGGSIQDVSNIVEALSSRFAAFGISGDRARRVTNGVIQAFAKGKLQAEELTQQIAEADPAFGTDFAKALGVSTAQLLAMVKAGQITTDVLITTIPQLSKSSLLYGKLGSSALDAATSLSSNAVTIDQVKNKIASLNQLSLEDIARSAEPLLYALGRIAAIFTDTLTLFSQSATVDALGRALGGVADAFARVVQTSALVGNGLLTVADPLVRVLELLLRIPFAAELIGLALIGKVIKPLVDLKNNLIKTGAEGGNALAKFLNVKTTGEGFAILKNNAINAFNGIRSSLKGTSAEAATTDDSFNRLQASSALFTRRTELATNTLAGFRDRARILREEIAKFESAKTNPLTPGIVSESEGSPLAKLRADLAATEQSIVKLERIKDKASKKKLSIDTQIANLEQIPRLEKSLITSGNATEFAKGKLATLRKELAVLVAQQKIYADQGLDDTAELWGKKVERTTGDISKYEGVLETATTKTNNTKAALESAGVASSKTGGFFSALGATTVRLAGFIGTGLVSAVRALFAALGPLGVILAAVGALQSAYSGAMQGARDETDKNTASAKAYKEILEEIGNTQPKEPELSPLQKGWQDFSINIAELFNVIGDFFNGIGGFFQGIGQKITEVINSLPGPIRDLGGIFTTALGALSFGLLGGGADKAGTKIRKLALSSNEAFKGIKDDSVNIIDAANALERFAKSAEGQTAEGSAKLPILFNRLSAEAEKSKERLNDLRAQVEDARAELEKTPSTGAAGKVSELEEKLKGAEAEFQKASDAVDKVGKKLGLVSKEGVSKAVGSFAKLEEKAKNSKEALSNAVPGSDDFKRAAANVSLAERAIAKLNEQAKDPKIIRVGIQLEQNKKYDELIQKQTALQVEKLRPVPRTAVVKGLEKEIAQLKNDLKGLAELRVEVDARSVANAEDRVKNLEEKIIKLDIQSPELPKLTRELLEANQEADYLKDKRSKITIELLQKGIQDGTINDSLKNSSELISALEGRIAFLDIQSPELPKVIAQLQDAKTDAESLAFSKAAIEIELLQKGIESGDIPESLNRTQELVSLLNGQVARLDINAPELEIVIDDLIKAEQRVGSLDGRKATITLELIQVGFDKGLVARTPKLLEQRTSLQQTVVENTPTTSPDFDKEVNKLREYEAAAKVASLSTQELKDKRTELANQGVGEKMQMDMEKSKAAREALVNGYEEEKNAIKANQDAFKAASDERIESYRKELDAIKQKADFEIQALERLTPAEAKLAAIREQELRKKIQRGTQQERLEAQAQLDQIERAKKIAEVKERLKAQEDAINKKIVAEKDAADAASDNAKKAMATIDAKIEEIKKKGREEEAKHQENMTLQKQKEYDTKQKERDKELKAINDELAAREKLVPAMQAQNEATADNAKTTSESLVPALEQATTNAQELAKAVNNQLVPGLTEAASKAEIIANQLKSINGMTVTVYIKEVRTPGRWAGGPVEAGQTYRVNELGKEGFLSASGTLTPIRKPMNALWRPTTDGTVIPAHIMKELSIPQIGVQVRAQKPQAQSSNNGLRNALSSIVSSVSGSNKTDSAISQLADVQANQALQIGKLSRAVSDLVKKNWDVHVNVRPSGNDSYLDLINRRM